MTICLLHLYLPCRARKCSVVDIFSLEKLIAHFFPIQFSGFNLNYFVIVISTFYTTLLTGTKEYVDWTYAKR